MQTLPLSETFLFWLSNALLWLAFLGTASGLTKFLLNQFEGEIEPGLISGQFVWWWNDKNWRAYNFCCLFHHSFHADPLIVLGRDQYQRRFFPTRKNTKQSKIKQNKWNKNYSWRFHILLLVESGEPKENKSKVLSYGDDSYPSHFSSVT